MKKITLLITLFLAAAIFAQTPPPIAIYVRDIGGFNDDERQLFAAAIMSSLENGGHYIGIDAQRNAEFVTQAGQDENHLAALGKSFGARFVCVAHVTPPFGTFRVVTPEFETFGTSERENTDNPLPNWRRCVACRAPFYLYAKIIDTETGDTLFSGNAYNPLETTTDLARLADTLVINMFNIAAPDTTEAPQKNRRWRR